jgi:predicted O-methyltransferase YrrM
MFNKEIEKILLQPREVTFKHILINMFIGITRIYKLNYFLAGLDLRRKSAECKNIEDCLNLIASYNFSIFKKSFLIMLWPWQHKTELFKLCKLISKNQPRIVLEIGTANGGTFFLYTKLANPNALIISIDLPSGLFGGGNIFNRSIFLKSFTSGYQKIKTIQKDSHNPHALKKVKKILKKRKIDLLFIDGDHTYKGVKKDFEMYAPLVKKGGIIAFHDIVIAPPEENTEVNKFWSELKHDYEYQEFVKDWNQKWGGIGVIRK